MTKEQEIVKSIFNAYIRDVKANSTKGDRTTFDKLEEVKNKAIKALEQPTHGTCKECKNNRKNPYARKHYTCELGNRYKLGDCDNFYCADFDKRGSESGL